MKTELVSFAGAVLIALASPSTSARTDTITEWNAHWEEAVFATAQPVPAQARSGAILHAAMFDAVNGIAREYTPYYVTEKAPPGARQEAATAQAAYTVLVALYPSQAQRLVEHLEQSLGKSHGRNASVERGRKWGEYVANQLLVWRSTDGWSTPPPAYYGGFEPGRWRSIPVSGSPDGTLPAVVSQLAVLEPFAMSHPAQFRPAPPYGVASLLEAIGTPEYAEDVNEVMQIGRSDSELRTETQTKLALLWQAMGPIDLNRAVRSLLPRKNSLVENARFFALANIATSDALTASMDSKFAYELWRPHHAVRLADTDGNPATHADPSWNALIVAPRFPEYVSNHSSLTAAFMHTAAPPPRK